MNVRRRLGVAAAAATGIAALMVGFGGPAAQADDPPAVCGHIGYGLSSTSTSTVPYLAECWPIDCNGMDAHQPPSHFFGVWVEVYACLDNF